MPDPYERLPEDDEAPEALLQDYKDYMGAAVPGWVPDDAAFEVALGAAFADEGSTLYALLREDADDKYRDFGEQVLGVPAAAPAPAVAETTWTARDAAPVGGYTIEAGQTLVIGGFGFEVLNETSIAEAGTEATGVLVQALDPGSEPNGAESPVEFDEPPAWVETVTVTSPAEDGTDGDTDEQHLQKVRRRASLMSDSPIQAEDYEVVAQEEPEVARALVLDNYDDDTAMSNQDLVASVYPIDTAGEQVSAGTLSSLADRYASRVLVNTIVRIGAPTYTTVDVEITVEAIGGFGAADVQARVEAAISDQVLNPATHGLPPVGERLTWQQKTTIRQYEVAAVAAQVEGVAFVDGPVLMDETGGTPVDADLVLPGAAPLPRAGVISVTVS